MLPLLLLLLLLLVVVLLVLVLVLLLLLLLPPLLGPFHHPYARMRVASSSVCSPPFSLPALPAGTVTGRCFVAL